jgi:hypothetical protein
MIEQGHNLSQYNHEGFSDRSLSIACSLGITKLTVNICWKKCLLLYNYEYSLYPLELKKTPIIFKAARKGLSFNH